MSRALKYMGMDVHQEGTVIAVLNGSGKLGMESIVETQASSILQFIHGLRGELQGTWEEGTWQLGSTMCCNPRCRECWSAMRGAMPYERKAAKATRWMGASGPTCCVRECCARSIPENLDCGGWAS